jgi:phosphatidylinositol-3-phosphatase
MTRPRPGRALAAFALAVPLALAGCGAASTTSPGLLTHPVLLTGPRAPAKLPQHLVGRLLHRSTPPPASGTPSSHPSTKAPTAPLAKHVVWIWMENHSYSEALSGSYTHSLATTYGYATNYHALGHPSLPNYIGATAGYVAVSSDCSPDSCPQSEDNLFRQADAAGIGWKAYAEGTTTDCDRGSHGEYAARHVPAVYYTDLSDCDQRAVPMGTTSSGALRSDLDRGSLPGMSFLTPDLCDDTHDCGVSTGDQWLQQWVPVILDSPQYRAGAVDLFITWDENDGSSGNQVLTVVVSPKTSHVASGTAFNHLSLLRTAEELLGLPLLRNAASATSMRQAFDL